MGLMSIGFIQDLFIQGKADPLNHAPFNLSFNNLGVDGCADIVGRSHFDHLNRPQFHIHFHFGRGAVPGRGVERDGPTDSEKLLIPYMGIVTQAFQGYPLLGTFGVHGLDDSVIHRWGNRRRLRFLDSAGQSSGINHSDILAQCGDILYD